MGQSDVEYALQVLIRELKKNCKYDYAKGWNGEKKNPHEFADEHTLANSQGY